MQVGRLQGCAWNRCYSLLQYLNQDRAAIAFVSLSFLTLTVKRKHSMFLRCSSVYMHVYRHIYTLGYASVIEGS